MSERAAQDWPQLFASLADSSRDPRLRAYYGAGCVAADTPLAEVPLVAQEFNWLTKRLKKISSKMETTVWFWQLMAILMLAQVPIMICND